MLISPDELNSYDRFYRANLINSLSGFKSASLIGTKNQEGISNLAIFSNIVHLGANPALIAFVNRPLEAAPHTLTNIEIIGFYTINHIHTDWVDKAHQTSAKYPEGVSEFNACGFTEEYIDGFTAPFVKESVIKYGMKLIEVVPIKHNNTFFVIGEVVIISVPESIISPDGFIEADKANSCCSLGIDGYYSTELIARLPYAKAK
ncbi:MAG: flavin reductase [Chitinophagales bacterium]|nr:flavin reductase [Chitinophagales bacterium]